YPEASFQLIVENLLLVLIRYVEDHEKFFLSLLLYPLVHLNIFLYSDLKILHFVHQYSLKQNELQTVFPELRHVILSKFSISPFYLLLHASFPVPAKDYISVHSPCSVYVQIEAFYFWLSDSLLLTKGKT